MTKEMLINTVEEQECRIAIVSGDRLEELYLERASSASHVGNIYKGRITNIEASIQAAFVDFGLPKNGFLHVSDLHPQYFPKGHSSNGEEAVGRKHSHRDRPPIQDCLKKGQEIVVQMTKEGIGTKGATMTTYLSIPGRLLVMMPGMSRLGVSRKIEDEEARQKAKQILSEMNVPADMGFIVRTAGVGKSKRDLQRDLNYLLRLWKSVNKSVKSAKSPAEIYRESDLVIRTIRDIYNNDIKRVICDNESVAWKAKEFLDVAMPRSKNVVELYYGKDGLFHDFGLEDEIEKIYSRRVELPSGGSLVIDQTEALVAIDVNSGRSRQHSDAETTALKTNIEAANEVTRQLRLRDLGGVVVIDFIDMRPEKNRRAVERALKDAIKPDRAKTKIGRISSFGLMEMTRQRLGPSLKSNIYRTCKSCDGMGLIKSEESQALAIMRDLQRACSSEDVARVEVHVTPSAAHHLTNLQRRQIAKLEYETEKTIVIKADAEMTSDEIQLYCTNARGSKVVWGQKKTEKKNGKTADTISLSEMTPAEPPKTPEDTNTDQPQAESSPQADQNKEPKTKKKRRSHRGGRKHRRSGEKKTESQETASTDTKKEAAEPVSVDTGEDKTKREIKEDKSVQQELPFEQDNKPAEKSTEKTEEKPAEKAEKAEKTEKPKRRRRYRKKPAKTESTEEKS